MSDSSSFPEATQRCTNAARDKGVEVFTTIFETAVPTAQAAANQLKIEVAQITNSLIFEIRGGSKTERRAILVCSSGDFRVDVKKLAAHFGVSKNKIKSASATTVLELTGFEAGGVGPCGFLKPFEACLVDEQVFRHKEVWCGAGVKPAMLRCTPEELLVICQGIRANVAEDSPKDISSIASTSSPIEQKCAEANCQSSDNLSTKGAFSRTKTAKTTSSSSFSSSSIPLLTFEDQMIGDGESGSRWYPEKSFEFHLGCPYSFSKPSTKQGHDMVDLPLLPFRVLIKQDPGHVGGIVWDAETLLAHHVVDAFAFVSNNTVEEGTISESIVSAFAANLSSRKLPLAGKKVLELGSGTGLSGIVACLLGAHVNFTELPEAIDLLRLNVESNLSSLKEGENHGERGTYEVNALKWGSAHHHQDYNETTTSNEGCFEGGEEYDLLLIADCVYLPEFYQDLAETILAASKATTQVLISFEQRRRDISKFFDQFCDYSPSLDHSDAPSAAAVFVPENSAETDNALSSGSCDTLLKDIDLGGKGKGRSEHLPGSDGRSLLYKNCQSSSSSGGGDNMQVMHPRKFHKKLIHKYGEEGKIDDSERQEVSLLSHLSWVKSSLTDSALRVSKVHLAKVEFVEA